MTINKKEQAELAALKNEVRIARALHWTDQVARDLPAPRHGGKATQGWDCDDYGPFVAWSTCSLHGKGIYVSGQQRATQNPRTLFTTEELALRACRNTIERDAAEKMAKIDARLEALRGAA